MKMLSNYPTRRINNICKIIGGKPAPKEEGSFTPAEIPFVRMQDLGRYHLTTNLIKTKDKISKKFIQDNNYTLVKKGSILIPRSGSVSLNHRAILGVDACIVSHICALEIITPDVDNTFLYYVLCKIDMRKIMKKTTGLDAITFEDLGKIEIPIPPLPVQKYIISVLECVEKLREKRQKANEATNKIIQSIFCDLFGNIALNDKGWAENTAGVIFDMKLGKMLSAKNYKGTHLKPYLRNINVQWGRLDLSDVKKMDFDDNEFKKYELKKGDILVCEGGEVGRTAVYNGEITACCYQNALHRLRIVKPIITKEYFIHYMFFAAKHGLILRDTSQVTIAHFTEEKFKKFKVLLPPMELQNHFAEIVRKIELIKEKQKQSTEEINTLFDALMQKAFNGELVL